ncbi:MAG: type II secretion system protein [Planctomycetes bacterium]|nr:type II secretion system protein [Planctomycetota bacterium]
MRPYKSIPRTPDPARGFTLLEVICALGILSIICSSALVIMSNNKDSAYDVTMRLRALEVARENMEEMLVAETIEEQTEFGQSEKYPSIEWENTIETFYAPLEGQTWARARVMARYSSMDNAEEFPDQEIELEHWLCRVTEADMAALDELGGSESGLIETIEQAAEFAGVDEQEVAVWMENGLAQTDEGYFIEANLTLFMRTQGNPSPEQLDQQALTGVFKDAETEGIQVEMDAPDVPVQDNLSEWGGR